MLTKQKLKRYYDLLCLKGNSRFYPEMTIRHPVNQYYISNMLGMILKNQKFNKVLYVSSNIELKYFRYIFPLFYYKLIPFSSKTITFLSKLENLFNKSIIEKFSSYYIIKAKLNEARKAKGGKLHV